MINASSLTLAMWQFLLTPLISYCRLTLICASYITQGRVTEFVLIDVAPSSSPLLPDSTLPLSALARFLLLLYHSPSSQAVGKKSRGGWGCAQGLHGLVTHFLPHGFLTVTMMHFSDMGKQPLNLSFTHLPASSRCLVGRSACLIKCRVCRISQSWKSSALPLLPWADIVKSKAAMDAAFPKKLATKSPFCAFLFVLHCIWTTTRIRQISLMKG